MWKSNECGDVPSAAAFLISCGKVVSLHSKDVVFRSIVLILNRFLIDYDGIFLKTFKEKKPKKKQPLRCFPSRHDLDCQGDYLLYFINAEHRNRYGVAIVITPHFPKQFLDHLTPRFFSSRLIAELFK